MTASKNNRTQLRFTERLKRWWTRGDLPTAHVENDSENFSMVIQLLDPPRARKVYDVLVPFCRRHGMAIALVVLGAFLGAVFTSWLG